MSVILILILASVSFGALFLGCFIWAVWSGQYEDTITPSLRLLTEDADGISKKPTTTETKKRQ